MKKWTISLILIILPLVAFADAVEINGIYYNLNNKAKIAEVTSNPNYYKYSGNVTIPEKVTYESNVYDVTSIGNQAFYSCNSLTSVTIPNSVTSIGKYAFAHCSQLNNVSVPTSIVSIEEWAFYFCTELPSITIPDNVTTIGRYAFAECSSLTSITIPYGITTLNDDLFAGCSGLTSVSIPNSVTSIYSYTFSGCTRLSSVIIPNSVNSIGDYAFNYCTSLLSINIPNSVTYIGPFAFNDCVGLTGIVIGNGVNYIRQSAFANCTNLVNVYCLAQNVPDTDNDTFNGSFVDYATLHVPAGSVDAYKAAEPWSNFNRIIDYDEVSISANNIRTSSSIFDLDFSNVTGLKAYIVSGFSPSTCTLVLTPATTVPAGVGLLLKGEAGEYVIPHTTTDMYYSNLLVGVPTTTYVYPTDGEYTNFILANGIHGINFYTLSEAGNIAGGKAYLKLPTSEIPVNSRALKLCFTDEEITGINTAQNKMNSSSDFYDLQGRKVKSPVKGLYVVNGKKVIIK